jgi:hypothetical protein
MSEKLNTLLITSEHVKDGTYTGPSVSAFGGHIEIAANLGWIKFEGSIVAKGHIWSAAGSGIEAGSGIKAGWGIEAGSGIKAGWGIKAGDGIEAGSGIKAGLGIEAGDGIKAGLSITCKFLSVRLRIFAGLINWRLPTDGDDEIRTEVRGGTVALGTIIVPTE